MNVEEHILGLARESAEIEYRDFIIEHLQKMSKSFPEDMSNKWQHFIRHWNLLRFLEKSFETDGTFKQNKVFGVGKDKIIVNESEIKALTIEKIEKYPDNWKSKVAANLFFDAFGKLRRIYKNKGYFQNSYHNYFPISEPSLLDFTTPLEIWHYLLEHNKAMILVHWINIQMSEVVRDKNTRYNFFNNDNFIQQLLNIDTKGLHIQGLKKLDEIFRKWSITEEMKDSIPKSNCFAYTKMCIYDTLCSYGIVNEDEKNNLFAIISRLARTQNLKLIDDIFSESCSTLNKSQFYVELAKYCVKNKLYKVLTVCVEGDDLENEISNMDDDVKNCIELWLLFKSIEQVTNRQQHVVPVYKTCEQLALDDINSYISDNPQLVLGMILLDDNAKLFDIFIQKDYIDFKVFQLPNRSYKEKLPHLYNVYKKYRGTSEIQDVRDVNVYQLLANYRGLDVSKIFEFQLVNQQQRNLLTDKPDRRSLGSLFSDNAKDSVRILRPKPVDMPHFANEKLMKRYGYVAKLNHMYYLRQYRPCNASQAFVTQQYQMYNRLQEKGIKNACCEAHSLALQNWDDNAMTACAISFVAMIGCNPARCRLHVTAAKMLKHHFINVQGMQKDQAIKEVNDCITKLAQIHETGVKEVLAYLENITMLNLKEKLETDDLDMSEILYECQIMVKFAFLHNLPLPELLLKEFVRKNMWFQFLLFADVFRYPLPQILEISQQFEKSAYAEHLKHILFYRNIEDTGDKSPTSGSQRKLSRLNSIEIVSSLLFQRNILFLE